MYINRTKKFIFLRVTKTGSTSIQNYLIDSIGTDEVSHAKVETNSCYSTSSCNCSTEMSHLNVTELLHYNLIKPDDLQDYSIYGIIRNPIDRFISACYHVPENGYRLPNIDSLSTDECVEYYLNRISVNNWLMLPQAYWLLHEGKHISNIFLYENLSSLVSSIYGKDIVLPYKHRNWARKDKSCNIHQDLQDEILRLYRTDYEIYQHYLRG